MGLTDEEMDQLAGGLGYEPHLKEIPGLDK